MKVTAILGSTHKGNGYRISEAIERKLKQLGVEEFERIWLKDIHLEMCRGCFACLKKWFITSTKTFLFPNLC